MYNATYMDAGSRSQFFTIDNERGFKEFDTKSDAIRARKTQLALAAYNCAPKVLSEVGKIRMRENISYDETGFSRWGFITELAEIIECGGNDCECGDCEDVYDNMYPKIKRLHKKIESLGYHFADDHIGNIGYVVRRGRNVLVCIDTGRESVYEDMAGDLDYDDHCSCTACRNMRGETSA